MPPDQEILQFYHDRNFERSRRFAAGQYSTDPIRACLDGLGNPQWKYQTIHVAGTVGKGSVSRLLARQLQHNARRVGCYTSPHLRTLHERISVNGEPINDAGLSRLWQQLRMRPQHEGLSFFDALTAMAFMHFADVAVDWAVIEAGLGGRLDSTNNLKPAAVVITPIDLDHQAILGDTVEAIARQKAGIMKPGVPAFSSQQSATAAASLKKAANEVGCELQFAEGRLADFAAANLELASLVFHRITNTEAAAIDARIDGVVQRLGDNLWFDGGHNAAAARAISGWISERDAAKWVILFNTMKERSVHDLTEPFRDLRAKHSDLEIRFFQEHSPLLHEFEELTKQEQSLFDGVMSHENSLESFRNFIVFGSTYLHATAKKISQKSQKRV